MTGLDTQLPCSHASPVAKQQSGHGGYTTRRLVFLSLLLITAVLAVYGRCCCNGLIEWDDTYFVSRPEHQPPTWPGLLRMWTTPHQSLYVPVSGTAWWLLAHLAHTPGQGLNPGLYHAASIAVHGINVLLVFALLRKLAGDLWAAALGAGLFALHPLQVEAVAWASELKDLLAGGFALAGVYGYLRMQGSPEGKSTRRLALQYLVVLLCFQLAVLSKPSSALMPLVAAILDRFLTRRPWGQIARSALPLALSVAPWLIVARIVQPSLPTATLPWLARLYVPGDSLYFYLSKLLLPVNLVPDYARNPEAVAAMGYCYWTWMIPLGLAIIVVAWRKRHPWLLAAALVAGIAVFPMLGFARFDFQQWSTVADHYVYLAMLGPAMAAAFVVLRAKARLGHIVGVLIVAALGALSFVQVGYWRDDMTLWERTLSISPRSALAMGGLGNLAARFGSSAAPLAADLLEGSLEARPEDPQALRLLIQFWLREGREDKAVELLKRLDAVADRFPEDRGRGMWTSAETTLGDLLLKRGEIEEAVSYYRKALKSDPNYGPARQGLEQAERLMQHRPTTRP